MFWWLRTMIMGLLPQRWHATARLHGLVDHDEIEAIRQRALDVKTDDEARKAELDWLRAYQGELEKTMRAVEVDAKVIARIRARVVGHD